ncbi:MAG: leucine-rich repeat protein [Clostridia bacterium]|nr:leucine-rich repeat protein [Clostridia bacterium]
MKELTSLVLVIAMFLGLCPTTIGAALTLPQSAFVQALAETSGDQSYEESLEETTDDYSYEQSSEEIVESSEVIVESSEVIVESSEDSLADVSEDISSEESSEDLEESINYSFDEATGTLAVTGNGAMADYTSASQTPWYSYQSSITKVVIEEGVTSVGDYAFSDCTALTSVSLPQSLTRIGNYAFYFCNNLADIAIPAAVEYIGDFAFYSCAKLASVVMPEGLTYIGISAFEYCITLATVTVPQSLTAISGYAFNNCNALNQVYYAGGIPQWDAVEIAAGNTPLSTAGIIYNYVPGTTVLAKGSLDTLNWHLDSNGLLVISGTGAMLDFTSSSTNAWRAHKSSIKEVYIKNSVTSIGDRAFYNCSGLTSVTIGAGVTSIGDSAFYNCYDLTSINIPDSVTSIGSYAFYYCSRLTSITIPDSVTAIGGGAFRDCSKLTSINIPDSVTTIGYEAFYNCSGLTSINIPDSVTAIGSDAFRGCSKLTSITIPDSVTSISSSAFRDCSGLTSITIPDSVTSIGSNAFYKCSGLTSITIPDSVTSIGSYAFSYCSGLTSITIPDSVTSIGGSAFYNCDSITSITIPDSVTSIGSDAFRNTGYYNDITNWENNVLYIGNHLIEAKTALSGAYTIKSGTITVANEAFYGSSVTGVTIPDSVTSIGYRAFYNCSGLTSVTVGAGVTAIGESAFYGCTSLTKVNITDVAAWCAVQFKNSYANPLYYAKNLYLNGSLVTKLVIPADVTSITPYAFYNCTSVTSISIPGTVSSIGSNAFYGCTNLKTVYYGGSSTQWSAIYIGSSNSSLTNATKNYNYFVTLSFAADHGSLSFTSLDVYPTTELSTVTFPTVTAAPNFRFVGWDNISGTITQDTVITAIFVRISASVSFIGVNGEVLSQQTVPYGQAATVPQIPPREGYNIIGWKDQNGNIISDFSSVREDMTLTAAYEQIMLKVYFVTENGSLSYTETTVPYGTDIQDIPYPTVTPDTGYHLTGWDKTEGTVKEELTFTAQFAINTYTVSFMGVYGDILSQQTVTHGFAAIAPAAPVYEGYEFAGWMDKAGNMIDSFDLITGDISVLACYKDLSYDYPAEEESKETTGTIGKQSENLLLGMGYSYYFEGTGSSSLQENGTQMTDGKYRGDGYNLWNGDLGLSGVTVEWYGTSRKVTYTFYFDSATDVDEVVIKNARIAANRGLNYVSVNGTQVQFTKTPVEGAPLYGSADTGYTDQYFDIYAKVSLKGVTTLEVAINADVYIKQFDEIEAYDYIEAKWLPVVFNDAEGDVISTQTVGKGYAAIAPAIAEREGYTVAGWANENGVVNTAFVTDEYDLSPAYEQIMVKVNFAAENGSLSYTETTVPYGTDIQDIPYPTVTPDTGYHLTGWDKTEGAVKEEITLTARFALKTYTVSFTGVYGETLSQQTVTHGYAAIAPAAPVYEGYEFAGWMDEAGNMIDSFDLITGDISVLACYKDLSYDYPTDEETSAEESEDNTESSAPNDNTTRGENLLLGVRYNYALTGGSGSASSSLPENGTQMTDGKYRGDGYNLWNGDLGLSGVTVEWFGTEAVPTYTFYFDSATDVDEVVIKNVRIASNRGINYFAVNGTEVQFTKTPVEGAPLYGSDDTGYTDQYFDVCAKVSLKGITRLEVAVWSSYDANVSYYIKQFDEIEAYGLSHTVNFVAENGTMTGDTQLSVSPGTELSTLTYPTVTPDAGYVFLGWDKTEGAVNENTTVKAIFGRTWSTVEFKDSEGNIISTQTVGKGYAAIVPQAPVHEGYTVAGWANENGVANTARITNNMSLTPIYEIMMVKVNFVSQMGTLSYTETTVPYGTDIKDIPYPTATPYAGYNLIGWDITEGTVKEEITLTAQFALKVYVVSFKAIDGSIISEQRILHGFDAIAPKAPAFEGYDFIGWAAENGVMTSKFNNITANASYTACYKESVVEEEVKHFEFAEGADATNVVVSTKTEQVYFKAGGMSAEELSAMFAGAEISITKANGAAVIGGSLVGTGCVITSTINGVTESRTIVVLGDINGDGKVNATDYAQVLNHAKGKVQLSGIKLEAANVAAAASATINAADYGQVLGFALGRTTKFNTAVE